MNAMERAARLAREGVEKGDGGPFGAVVVDADGRVVGEAWNRVVGTNDPTAHAEILAIRAAGKTLGTFRLTGCTLYATGEPCPMCLAAIHWAHIEKVVYAQTRRDAASIGFDDERLYEAMRSPEVEMEHVESPEAAEVFRLWAEDPDRVQY